MDKTELLAKLSISHDNFANYIDSLANEKFNAQLNEKWNAGKELDHIVKSIEPLAKILCSKTTIIENFGVIDRPTLSFIDLRNKYKDILKNGGTAIGRFVPEQEIGADRKAELVKKMLNYIHIIKTNLTNFSEDELDNLVLPHPLIGPLTIREMIYFTIYHAEHHVQNIKRNIESITATKNL